MQTTIIALCGPAGSGKSTVANHLVNCYGAVKYSFAQPLKEMVKRAFDLTDEQVYGTQEQKEAVDPRYNQSARWLLQRIGTDGCRATFGEDFWTKMLVAEGGLIWRQNPALAVIEDCRFINEADAVSAWDRGFVWRLWPVDDARSAEHAANAGKHASEEQWRELQASLEIRPPERGIPVLLELVDRAMQMVPVRSSADGVRW